MSRYKKIICIAMSCVLVWNSGSYIVNAQGNSGTNESTEVITDENTEVISDENTEVISDENTEVISDENIEVISDENTDVSNLSLVETDDEYIKNLVVETDNKEKEIKLTWEKEENVEFDSVEITLYTKEDKSDEKPIIVEVTDSCEVVLGDETVENGLEEGKVYFIDVKVFKSLEDEKVYGKALSTVAVLLTKPVVTAKAGDAQYTLEWEEVAGATAYEVFDADTNELLQTVTKNSVTVEGVDNNVKYNVKVKAIAEIEYKEADDVIEEYVYTSDFSEVITVSPKIIMPAKISGYRMTPYNLGINLMWNASKNATSYEIQRYDATTKKWKVIKNTTSTVYRDTKLTNGRKYYYKVAAVRTSGGVTAKSGFSSQISITAKKYVTGTIHGMYYGARCKKTCPMYTTSTSKQSVGKLKKGTKVTVISTSVGKRTLIQLSNGKKYYISKDRLYYNSCKYTTLDYTTAAKEAFVNSKGYSSKTGYLIWISSYTQRVNVFKGSKGKWKLHKTYKCATGKATTRTIRGTFTVQKKASKYGGRTYEKWVTFFYKLNSFHSRLYRGGRIVDATIGKPASNGCIRMYTDECYWIYKNIPKKTTVVSL